MHDHEILMDFLIVSRQIRTFFNFSFFFEIQDEDEDDAPKTPTKKGAADSDDDDDEDVILFLWNFCNFDVTITFWKCFSLSKRDFDIENAKFL